MLRTAVIGTGHLGKQHARVHSLLSEEGRTHFVLVCDQNEATAKETAAPLGAEWTTDWRNLLGRVDAVSLAVPTESHAEIACALLRDGIHVLVEKPISRTLEEADEMIRAAKESGAVLQIGHLERFNPALRALKPYVRQPLYFEIHRVGEFTARSLDIDVVLDLMIHDLDIVQWLVGPQVEVTDIRAVGIPVLTHRVDAANARLEFSNGAVANITASRIGTEKIRKMRFFQPHDYIAVDYVTRYASISSLVPATTDASRPAVNFRKLQTDDTEPLRAEIESFIRAIKGETVVAVGGDDGKRALALALRALDQIHGHAERAGLNLFTNVLADGSLK